MSKLRTCTTFCASALLMACPADPGTATSGSGEAPAASGASAGKGEGPADGGSDAPAEAGDADSEAPATGEGPKGEAEAEGEGEAGDAEAGAEVAAADPAQAPPDYGQFKIKGDAPPLDSLKNHGLAGYGVVAVYSEPNMESEKLGFLRLGTRMKVGDKIKSDDCRKGWYALETGGYACASKGLVVEADKPPFLNDPPPPPRKDEPFPYDWAYVKRWNSPMWWRPAKSEERKQAQLERAKLEAARTGEPLENFLPEWAKPKPEPKPKAAADDGGSQGEGGAPDLSALPGVDDPDPKTAPKTDPKPDPKPEAKPDPKPEAKPEAGEPEASPEDEEEKEPINLPLSPEHPWLEKGYFISLAGKNRDGGHTFWHTARGGYVSTQDAYTYKAKDFQGVELTEEMSFPVGFVKTKSAKVYELKEDDKLKYVKKLERRDFVDLEAETEIRGKAYMVTTEGQLIAKENLTIPEPQPLPEGLDPWERWVDVDLSDQILVAYEGTKPVFTTLVSTGKKGSEEEPFETPTGRWRIYSKQLTSNMDGTTASDGNYAIQDVPWVMYFEGSYALHGAFWHRSFGSPRSHGCVNLGPSDARWLYFWTTPFVPDLWHGAHAGNDNPGSTVIVRE